MEYIAQVCDLTKRYEGFTLDSISLGIPNGTIVGFIGSNGAGKTTTIKLLLGIVSPDAGTISLFGETISPDSPQFATLRQDIGVVFDSCMFPDDLRIDAIARLGHAFYARWDDTKFRELIKTFSLDEHKKVKDLSRGMDMKLSLAFALSHHPRLLILDEATAGIDPLARDEILDILRDYMNEREQTANDRNDDVSTNNNGCGILLSSHITSDLEKIADEVVCIDEGRILFDLPKDEICDQAGIVRCRHAEFEDIVRSKCAECESLRYLDHPSYVEILVPDRFRFQSAFPLIICERASIDDYMSLTLKGRML